MAFDGTVIACIAKELNEKLPDGRIAKIAQPEKDGLLLTVKKDRLLYKLFISVNASLPMIYLTEKNLPSPMSAPAFCMLLRKHLMGGRILSITQPSMERILVFEIEHYNEMGDLCKKKLIAELMGKHSNLIFTEENRIIDSIKHVSGLVSSVREVLPGRDYFIPFADSKLDPKSCVKEDFFNHVFSVPNGNLPVSKALYLNLTGFSPALAEELLFRADLDSSRPVSSFTDSEKESVYTVFADCMELIRNGSFSPYIVYKNEEPVFYAPFPFSTYQDLPSKRFESISQLLYTYYSEKQSYTSIRQKTADLRQVINSLLSKDHKKYDLQLKQMKDTEKKETYRLYGELLTAYGYHAEPKATFLEATDYYTGNQIRIPLDPTMSAIDNAKKYFDKYAKLKRTAAALTDILEETREEIEHLESISASLETIKDQADIAELKKEMEDAGYIRKHHINTKNKKGSKNTKEPKGPALKSTPLHYLSADGYDMYVGKNNFQNDYLSFQLANGSDWWFHAKKIPGSHVIVKSKGEEIPDTTFEQAARLAAHYSKAGHPSSAGTGDKVEVDYVQKKHLKKTPGGKPGFVIYHTNYSMSASTDISDIKEVPFSF